MISFGLGMIVVLVLVFCGLDGDVLGWGLECLLLC